MMRKFLGVSGRNMPNAEMFKTEAAKSGIDFSLQHPLFYERVQLGITANPTPRQIEVYVENFSMRISDQ